LQETSRMRRKTTLFILFVLMTFCCIAQTPYNNQPSDPSLIKGKGELSFNINGKLYKSNPTQTKCWTTANVPIAVLWSKGEGIMVSWQIQDMRGKGIYKLNKDSSGTANFTIAGNTYWVRRTDGSNYLNITITAIANKYNLKLLSGFFDAVLEDKNGRKIRITEGRFITSDI
jgi:hypothetical protein